MDNSEKIKALIQPYFDSKGVLLPSTEWDKLLEGKKTHFVFSKENISGQEEMMPVMFALDKRLLTNFDNYSGKYPVLKFFTSKELAIPNNLKNSLSEQELKQLNFKKFIRKKLDLSKDGPQDFYVRVDPYLNHVEAFAVNSIKVPPLILNHTITEKEREDLKNGKAIQFMRESGFGYDVLEKAEYDPINRRFRIAKADIFDQVPILPVNENVTLTEKSIIQIRNTTNNEKFSIEVGTEINAGYSLQDLFLSQLTQHPKFVQRVFGINVNQLNDNFLNKLYNKENSFELNLVLDKFINTASVHPINRNVLTTNELQSNANNPKLIIMRENQFLAKKTLIAYKEEFQKNLTKDKEQKIEVKQTKEIEPKVKPKGIGR